MAQPRRRPRRLNDEPNWTRQTGDPIDVGRRNPARKLTDFLGRNFTDEWPPELKALTYEDLLRINGWIPPDNDDADSQEAAASKARVAAIDEQDLMDKLALAIQQKTGWKYISDEPPACCCTWPGWFV
jgi:hypothetical protein